MELLKELNNHESFDSAKNVLTSSPYNLKVTENNEDNTFMISYNKDSEKTNDFINECRGIILEKDTNKVVCYTFNRKHNSTFLKDELLNNWDACKFYESIDGTQIKLYYYNDKWNVSTTRCIQAKNAYWYSKKSFEELFKEASFGLDYSKLNKDYCYSFVLKHKENRIVNRYEY